MENSSVSKGYQWLINHWTRRVLNERILPILAENGIVPPQEIINLAAPKPHRGGRRPAENCGGAA